MRSPVLFVGAFLCAAASAQIIPSPKETPPPQPETPADALGRSTPRSTVFGFLKAAREDNYALAVQYLNTNLAGDEASNLAHELYTVLDKRLPARLNELSDKPEGSMAFPATPDQDLIGAIPEPGREVPVVVEKVKRGANPPIWLFSRATLAAIPELYSAIDTVLVENVLPPFLVRNRIGRIALFEWIAVFIVLPCLYWLTGLFRRVLGRLLRLVTKRADIPDAIFLPQPIRLIALVIIIRWALSKVDLPLLARQFWLGMTFAMTVIAIVWLLVLFSGLIERFVRRRLQRARNTGAISVLRFGRRLVDLVIVLIGILVGLHHFGVDLTAALAGLGVSGIAIALAAQKTLENVFAGISIIFDHVVQVGDLVKTGGTMGFIEFIGLRSTRIRTLDQTVVSVPNGQLANAAIENFSAREKFWFTHFVMLSEDTAAPVLRSVVESMARLLAQHTLVDSASVRVRFLRLGSNSLDIEIFAYVLARSFEQFLEIQQELLIRILEIIESAGARRAIPATDVHLTAGSLAATGDFGPLAQTPNHRGRGPLSPGLPEVTSRS